MMNSTRNRGVCLFKRAINIDSAPVSSSIHQYSSPQIQLNAEHIGSVPKNDLERPQFRTMGTPPTLINVSLAPSLPVYFQKGVLISMYGTNLDNITLSSVWLSALKRIMLGLHSFRYQKIESIRPAVALISGSPNGKSPSSTVTPLTLDGSVDWALLPPDSLLAYSGSSLRISTEKIPIFIRKDGWVKVGKTKTGLYAPWRSGYTLVSGRGDVVVKGEGSIYSMQLREEEEVLIKRNNIVGISVYGNELAKCVTKHETVKEEESKPKSKLVKTEVIKPETKDIAEAESKGTDKQIDLHITWAQIKSMLIQARDFAKYYSDLALKLVDTEDCYVKIKGPRTVLLQSNQKRFDLFGFAELSKVKSIDSADVADSNRLAQFLHENNQNVSKN